MTRLGGKYISKFDESATNFEDVRERLAELAVVGTTGPNELFSLCSSVTIFRPFKLTQQQNEGKEERGEERDTDHARREFA